MAYVVYGLQTLLRWFRDTFEENMAVLPTYARTLQLTMVATVMCATPPPPRPPSTRVFTRRNYPETCTYWYTP